MDQFEPSSFQPEPPPAPVPQQPQGSQPPRLFAEPRKVPAGEGAAWIGDAWRIFKKRPGTWVLMIFIMFLIMFVGSFVPGVSMVTNLLPLFFTGGFMLSCDALEEGGELEVGYLFSGFKYKFKELVILTLLYFTAILFIVLIAGILLAAFVGFNFGSDFQAAVGGNVSAEDFLMVILLFLIMLLFIIPVQMTIVFSPALVVLHDVPPFEAMKMSFKGCLKNLGAFLVNGLAWAGISLIFFGIFFAIIALSAGVSSMSSGDIGVGPAIAMFLLFIPIYFVLASLTSLTSYTCYRSIWTDPPLRRNGR